MAVVKRVAWVVLIAAALSGCRKDNDYNGIGQWVLLNTTLSDAEGACTPGEITFCSHADTLNVGGQPASVNLYFRGSEPTAPLVEIELTTRSCDPNGVGSALFEFLGPPQTRRDKRMFWNAKRAYVSAKLPGRAGRCVVNYVTPEDTKRIAELAAE